jgi:O-antigen/teichoic acid export membrane protein
MSRIAAIRRSRVTSIAGSILGTQVVTSALGFVFWTVAAWGLPPEVVGRLGSATAAALLLGLFGIAGCDTLLISRLGGAGPLERRRLLATSTVVSGGVTTALTVILGVAAWQLLPSFAYLAPSGATFWWLIATAVLTAIGGVYDQAMLVLGKPSMQVVRNGVASTLKVALLAVALMVGRGDVDTALAAWVVGQVIAIGLAVGAAWRLTPTTERITVGAIRDTAGRHWREAVRHHGMNVALMAPSVLQPVIIAAAVSAESNALFTTVRLVSTFAFMAPYALAMALFAASAGEPAGDGDRARSVFRMSLGLSLGLYGVLFFAAPVLLGVFGHAYATGGVTYLRIIGLACPLLVFKDQYVAQMRAGRTPSVALPYVVLATALEIAGTLAGAVTAGVAGALIGWLTALALGAAWVTTRGRPVHSPLVTTGAVR